MVDLNSLKELGWLTDRQLMEQGKVNPSLMKRILREKGREFPDQRKVVLRRKDGENDHIYSPFLIKKIILSFQVENYAFLEEKRNSLKKEDCYTSKELARKLRTSQGVLMQYVEDEGMRETGLVKEVKDHFLIHKDLYLKLEVHFLSGKKVEFRHAPVF